MRFVGIACVAAIGLALGYAVLVAPAFEPYLDDQVSYLRLAHGFVIAGVDLGRLLPSDIELDDAGRIYVTLPEPEVFVATLDNDKTYVYHRDTGILTRGNVQLETEARRAAEAAIRESALEDGILDQARVNAEGYLFGLFRTLGYADVVFSTATEARPVPTPTPLPVASPTP